MGLLPRSQELAHHPEAIEAVGNEECPRESLLCLPFLAVEKGGQGGRRGEGISLRALQAS
jgi:hypothetical protein